MLVLNNLGFLTILWAGGHAGNVSLVDIKIKQMERALGSEIEMVKGEVGGLKVQVRKVEADVEYLKAQQEPHDRLDTSAQQKLWNIFRDGGLLSMGIEGAWGPTNNSDDESLLPGLQASALQDRSLEIASAGVIKRARSALRHK